MRSSIQKSLKSLEHPASSRSRSSAAVYTRRQSLFEEFLIRIEVAVRERLRTKQRPTQSANFEQLLLCPNKSQVKSSQMRKFIERQRSKTITINVDILVNFEKIWDDISEIIAANAPKEEGKEGRTAPLIPSDTK